MKGGCVSCLSLFSLLPRLGLSRLNAFCRYPTKAAVVNNIIGGLRRRRSFVETIPEIAKYDTQRLYKILFGVRQSMPNLNRTANALSPKFVHPPVARFFVLVHRRHNFNSNGLIISKFLKYFERNQKKTTDLKVDIE